MQKTGIEWVKNPDGTQGYTSLFDRQINLCYYNPMEVAQWTKNI